MTIYPSSEELNWIDNFVPILRMLAKRNSPEFGDHSAWFYPINWDGGNVFVNKEVECFCRICRQNFKFPNSDKEYRKFVIEHGTMHLKEKNLLPFI